MSIQRDSVTRSDDGDKIVITCRCGVLSHGAVQIYRGRYKDSTGEWDTEEYDIAFQATPTTWKWWHRFRNAWQSLFLIPIEVDLCIHPDDAKKVAEFLTEKPEWEEA